AEGRKHGARGKRAAVSAAASGGRGPQRHPLPPLDLALGALALPGGASAAGPPGAGPAAPVPPRAGALRGLPLPAELVDRRAGRATGPGAQRQRAGLDRARELRRPTARPPHRIGHPTALARRGAPPGWGGGYTASLNSLMALSA